MKKLFALISTEGKTRKQITQKVWGAFKKYNKQNEKATKALEEKQWRKLLDMAKTRGEQKKLKMAENRSK